MASSTSWAGMTLSVPGTCWGMNRPFSFLLPHSICTVWTAFTLPFSSPSKTWWRWSGKHGDRCRTWRRLLPGRSPCGRPWAIRARGFSGRAGFGGLGHNFQLGNAGAAMANGGADAVRAGVATADDHHILTGSGRCSCLPSCRPAPLGYFPSEIPWQSECPSAPGLRWASHGGRVEPVQRTTASKSFIKVSEDTSLPTSVLHTKVTPSASRVSSRRWTTCFLSNFMLGMPYISSPPGRVGPFIHRDPVTRGVELGGGRQTSWTGADDGDFFCRCAGGAGWG